MRIKTVPRHRMLQSSIKIHQDASASRSSSEESDADIEKDYDSIGAINVQDSCQVGNYVTFFILLYIVKLIFI